MKTDEIIALYKILCKISQISVAKYNTLHFSPTETQKFIQRISGDEISYMCEILIDYEFHNLNSTNFLNI